MRRFVVIAVSAFSLSGTGAAAQERSLPNTFPTLSACTEALRTGQLRFYEPRYFGLATRNPVNNRDRVVVPLESDACLQMLVVGGVRFVAQREGTLFRAQRLADGSLSLYARDDCGNPVYNMVVSPVPAPPPPPQVRHVPQGPPPPVRQLRERDVAVVIIEDDDDGFCSSKKCRWTLAAIGGAALGYTAYRLWPCPPGTRRR